jgi:hypothetical protein
VSVPVGRPILPSTMTPSSPELESRAAHRRQPGRPQRGALQELSEDSTDGDRVRLLLQLRNRPYGVGTALLRQLRIHASGLDRRRRVSACCRRPCRPGSGRRRPCLRRRIRAAGAGSMGPAAFPAGRTRASGVGRPAGRSGPAATSRRAGRSASSDLGRGSLSPSRRHSGKDQGQPRDAARGRRRDRRAPRCRIRSH